MFKFRSIRAKFVLFISLLVFLPIGGFVGLVIDLHLRSLSKVKKANERLMTSALQEEWEEKVRVLADLLAKKLIQPMHELDVSEMKYHAQLTMVGKDGRYVYIMNEEGRILVDTTEGSEWVGEMVDNEFVKAAMSSKDLVIERRANIIDIYAPILAEQKVLGVVRVGFSPKAIQETTAAVGQEIDKSVRKAINTTVINTLLFLPIVTVPAIIIGWLFISHIVLPIKKLVLGTEKIATGDLTYRIETRSRDEIGQLAIAFNKMTEDLQKTTVTRDYVDNIIKSMADTLVVLTPEGLIQTVNRAACNLLGYIEEELVGKPFSTILAEEQPSRGELLEELIKKGFITDVEKTYLTKDGRRIPMLFSGSVMRRSDGKLQGMVCVALDITERKQAEETIYQMAYYDPLTGLPNRMLLNDRLTVALAHAYRHKERLAVLFLDLDGFKDINDTLGHTVGDQVLQGVAGRLKSCVREADTVARIGGDEFTLILPGTTQGETVARVAQKILDTIKQPWKLGGQEFCITSSIGIALYPDDGEEAEVLLKNADLAMYHAKEKGKGTYHHYVPTLHVQISERLRMESSLRFALEREELVVHYQPQINVLSGQIVGLEALVRWQHPNLGLLSPEKFIPFAEGVGLVVSIDEWVLRTTCTQNKVWQARGLPPLRMSVNLSSATIQQPNAVEMVDRVLKETGLSPHLLGLEVTESALQNIESISPNLRKLKDLGIQVTFSIGHSSLRCLREFPHYSLKVSRHFIRELKTDPNTAAIVAMIIALSKSLKTKVIAEGVETDEQLTFLKQQHCDEVQGYLFYEPVPAQVLEGKLRQA